MERTAPAVDLDVSAGYRLKEASAALHAVLEEALRPLGLTITQYSTLELLAQRPGLSGSALARGAFVTRQSMAQVLQSLLAQGAVVRAATAARGRELPVELTAAGRSLLRAASAAARAVEDRMLTGFDADEAAALRGLLDRCTRSLRAVPAGAAID